MRAVVDTNVLIDFLQGVAAAAEELERYDAVEVSVISLAELLVGASDETASASAHAVAERAVDALIGACEVVPVDEAIAREAAFLRRAARVRFPGALIWATARTRGSLLVTRDEGFPTDAPEVRHPYQR